MLTGYIGSVTFLRAVAKVHKALRAANPNLRYVCDPVGPPTRAHSPRPYNPHLTARRAHLAWGASRA